MSENQALDYIKNYYEAFSSNENRNYLLKILSKFNNDQFYEKAIKLNPYFIKEINNPSYELCFKAVEQTGAAIQYVPEDVLDNHLCEASIRGFWHNINFIPINLLTPELCLFAIDHYKKSKLSEEFDSEFLTVFCVAYECEIKTISEAIMKFKNMISKKNKNLIKETMRSIDE